MQHLIGERGIMREEARVARCHLEETGIEMEIKTNPCCGHGHAW